MKTGAETPRETPAARRRGKAHGELPAVEGRVSEALAGVQELVKRTRLALQAGDCATARLSHDQAAIGIKAARRELARLSTLYRCLGVGLADCAAAVIPPPAAAAPACPADREECGYTVEGAACTVTAPLRVPARGGAIGTERTPARYCLVEIGQLHTSHQPLKGFAPDPEFPEGAQERDYRQTAERAKVEEIAQHYDASLIFNTSPGALDGVPVATEQRIVLGGNGRTMATSLVYAGRGGIEADAPRRYLVEHAHEFGLAPSAVEAFARPMLVRTIRVDGDARTLAEWSRRLNTSLSQQLDSTHLAVSRARFVSEGALRELGALGDDETLAAFLASARSRSFVRSLQASGVIDGRAAATYISDGLLNEQGRDLVADLLVAVLVPDAALIGAYGRGPVAALARAAPAIVQASQWPEYDLRAALRKAVRDRVTMRAQSIGSVGEYLRQTGLFAGATAAVEGDEQATILLRVLGELDGAPVRLTRFARRYAQLAEPAGVGQGALFAGEQLAPLDALRRAAADVGLKLP
jgi:DdrB-like nuclease